ncbi:MAG: hypothetical protein OQK82_00945 [Candidatus Pacearchaeota archaeon]|nr:hypothetical protein [Candidatus Pacearchaeota archaeon]
MKNKIIFSFFIFGIFSILIFNFFSYSYTENKLLKDVSSILTKDSQKKANEINSYLSKIKTELETLQDSKEIKELLKQDLIFREDIIKMNVNEKSRIISKEAENYLKAYPKMTLENLQKDEIFYNIDIQPISKNFKNIIIQPVGKQGYSFAYDTQTLINYFHKEERRIGYDYNNIKDTFPDLWKIFKETSKKGSHEGFYYRDEEDGSISYKYGKFTQLSFPTADGINISLGTTAYVKDYKIIENNSDYLRTIKENSDYQNLILISPNGYIIYMVDQMEYLGSNLEWEVNLEKGLSKHYFNMKEHQNISFYGPFIEKYGTISPEISIMAPIYEENTLLGYACIIEDMNKIFKMAEDIKTLGKTGESYLIDVEETLISPLRNKNLNIMIQSIKTNNTESCIRDIRIWENNEHILEHQEEFSIYKNYKGEDVFGTHSYIPKLSWCIISEINKSETIESQIKNLYIRNIYFSIIILLIFLIIGILYYKVFNKTKKYFKINFFFKHLHHNIFFILFIVLLIYILKVPKTIEYIGLIPDIISLIIFSLLFFYIINKKSEKPKKLILSGIVLCIFSQIMQISIEGNNFENIVAAIIWSIIMATAIIGIYLILLGFKEVANA